MSAPAFTYYTFGTDITEDDLLANPDDPAEEAFNKIDFAMTLGLLEIYNNHPAIMAQLVSDINGTRNKIYSLLTFANDNPTVNTIFNTIFAQRFEDFSNYTNWQDFIDQNYHYDTTYTPFVHFANIGANLDVNLQPYVAAPFEINEEKFTNFSNHIPVWIGDGNGGTKLTAVNEPMAKQIFNPLVLVSNANFGCEESIYNPIYEEPVLPPVVPMSCGLPPTQHLHEHLSQTKFKINHRYERTGQSDVTFIWVARLAYLPSNNNWADYTVTGSEGKDVHKNDIGKLIDYEFVIFTPDMFQSPGCFEIELMSLSQQLYEGYAFGVYEKDWYSTFKNVMNAKNSSGWETWKGRRKFENEWYYFNPADNNSYNFAQRNPTRHSTYTNYTKGEIRLHRWD
ncbi:hypothetical protein GCM10009415_33040 [Chitinophaga japonensis]